MKVCRDALVMSHLFFADDSVMFARATKQECCNVKKILHQYEMAFG